MEGTPADMDDGTCSNAEYIIFRGANAGCRISSSRSVLWKPEEDPRPLCTDRREFQSHGKELAARGQATWNGRMLDWILWQAQG